MNYSLIKILLNAEEPQSGISSLLNPLWQVDIDILP
jgi:hypothetical protein